MLQQVLDGSSMEHLILVDRNDVQIGKGEKLAVHQRGELHRCFSIFVFNDNRQVLMQKRARTKYHSGGLWTNTCCGHPRDGEKTDAAAHRRLYEEMGFECEMTEMLTFIYRAELDKGLIEHEFDHVFVGQYDGPVTPNPEEADGYMWSPVEEVRKELTAAPERFTVWSIIAFNKLVEHLHL